MHVHTHTHLHIGVLTFLHIRNNCSCRHTYPPTTTDSLERARRRFRTQTWRRERSQCRLIDTGGRLKPLTQWAATSCLWFTTHAGKIHNWPQRAIIGSCTCLVTHGSFKHTKKNELSCCGLISSADLIQSSSSDVQPAYEPPYTRLLLSEQNAPFPFTNYSSMFSCTKKMFHMHKRKRTNTQRQLS